MLPIFSANAIAWAAATYPDRSARFSASAFKIAEAAALAAPAGAIAALQGAASIARTACYKIDSLVEPGTVIALSAENNIASARSAIFRFAHDAFWFALSSDATSIDEGATPFEIATYQLWPVHIPPKIEALWDEMKHNLLAAEEDWEVWTDWYDERLAGNRADKKLEIARATIPSEIWERGPAVVNAHIKELIEKHKRRPQAAASKSRWDFFLSYSSIDEPFAQFVDGTLRGAGYRIFAQFRDMPPGSNFVREMNKGLAGSSRVIALLSSSYFASDHCQAEWSAVYGADPGGTSRKLVPLLIEPCDPGPLAKQIVYKSLVGLSAGDAAAAILEAIGHSGLAQPPSEPWPGSAALDAMTRGSRDVFDVEPGKTHRLRRKSSAPATGTIEAYGFTPEDLYADIRGGIAEFVTHVCNNRQGNFGFSDRLRSHARNLLESAPEALTACEPLNINRALVGVLRALFHDEAEGSLPPNDMIANYKSDLVGYYKRLEALYPQLTTFRQQNARDRFTVPNERQQRGLEEFLEVVPTDRDVVEPELSKGLQETKAVIDSAQNLSPSGTEEQKKADLVEPHMSAAAQAVPIWNWLANAREKFIKSGKSMEDVAKAIDSYQKLYNRIPHMKDYMDWLTSWLF